MLPESYLKFCRENWQIYKPMWIPAKGDLCVCKLGYPGILTSEKKRRVIYPGKKKGNAYIGFNPLTGKEWSSRAPVWCPRVDQLYEMLHDFGFVGYRSVVIRKPQAAHGDFVVETDIWTYSRGMKDIQQQLWREGVREQAPTLQEALLAILIEVQESCPDTLAYEEVDEKKK